MSRMSRSIHRAYAFYGVSLCIAAAESQHTELNRLVSHPRTVTEQSRSSRPRIFHGYPSPRRARVASSRGEASVRRNDDSFSRAESLRRRFFERLFYKAFSRSSDCGQSWTSLAAHVAMSARFGWFGSAVAVFESSLDAKQTAGLHTRSGLSATDSAVETAVSRPQATTDGSEGSRGTAAMP